MVANKVKITSIFGMKIMKFKTSTTAAVVMPHPNQCFGSFSTCFIFILFPLPKFICEESPYKQPNNKTEYVEGDAHNPSIINKKPQ